MIKRKIRSSLIGAVIGTALALALVLTGCGANDTAADAGTDTEADIPEVEQLDDDGNVIDENEDNRDYLEEVGEDEIKDLAGEALEEAGLDTSLTDDTMMTFGLTFDIPEGFEEDPDRDNYWVTGRYPIEASSIYYAELDPDYTLQMMDEEYFKQILENAFTNGDEDVTVNITEFEATTISGIPAFRIKAEYDIDDIHLEHLMIVVNGSKTYVVIYTQTDEYDRMELFEQSADSIKVKK